MWTFQNRLYWYFSDIQYENKINFTNKGTDFQYFIYLMGFNVTAAIFQLYRDDQF